ncbi:MAG: hypothetical protein IKX23_03785 [Treponema sp.]|nr:hypothetical protein [Treponema sp.]
MKTVTVSEINEIPKLLAQKKITSKQAMDYLSLYFLQNYRLFKSGVLSKDFQTEIIITLLENREIFFEKYNYHKGCFYTYYFNYIKNLILNKKRKYIMQNIKEELFIEDSIADFESIQNAYENINYSEFDFPKAPYSYKINEKNFTLACSNEIYTFRKFINENNEEVYSKLKNNLKKVHPKLGSKILIILALKSAFYITDFQIETICKICSINPDSLRELIQIIKEKLEMRAITKQRYEMRRNRAYMNHKKYRRGIEFFEEEQSDSHYYTEAYKRKYRRNTICWNNLNSSLQTGFLHLRPSNKMIAEILGICERQVSYYLRHARELGIKI